VSHVLAMKRICNLVFKRFSSEKFKPRLFPVPFPNCPSFPNMERPPVSYPAAIQRSCDQTLNTQQIFKLLVLVKILRIHGGFMNTNTVNLKPLIAVYTVFIVFVKWVWNSHKRSIRYPVPPEKLLSHIVLLILYERLAVCKMDEVIIPLAGAN